MSRNKLLLSVLAAALLCVAAFGQGEIVLHDLHLVAVDDIPGGSSTYDGPVSAAILMAWHAEHGYSQLLPDLNGDGRIDEQDTIELAIQFADPMRADRGPVRDPFLVDTMAEYVAQRYPDTFQLWVYDPSLPDEYNMFFGQPFDPMRVPGIEIVILEEPSHRSYVDHLEEDRPGVVGIGFEPEPNDFAVSRSARLQEEPEGWPVGLANTSHEAFGPGSIWETLLREAPEFWEFDRGEWIQFETLIVLVPIRDPGEGEPEEPQDEPDDPGGKTWDDPDPGEPGDDPGEPGGDPGDDPQGNPLPNLWVTNMTGCWSWSNDGREHVIATVTGIVHNGGQATATGVKARVTANGVSKTVSVGTLTAGSQKQVSAILDLGSIDTMIWPVQTSIMADPANLITEADETNNNTNSAFPQSSTCN